nr:saccharopine dehydrogenase NADP-binding domain-containing protein [Deltaproteobacteria bacterium]
MTTRNILVLGAGMIARPLLRYFLTHPAWQVLVATDDVRKASHLMGEHPRGRVIALDVRDTAALAPLIAESHVVVSLLPAGFNPAVARLCIAAGRPFVNTSYTAPEMWALDEAARKAGVLVLNEIGLDPGIDHMSAVALVRSLAYTGATIVRFESACGGFPAADANTNPWGYKFSWSPQGVMRAGRRPARYVRDGSEIAISDRAVFDHSWPFAFGDLGVFEVYPNRDSHAYLAPYGLTGARGMFRGTIRYPGWCATMSAAVRLGLL